MPSARNAWSASRADPRRSLPWAKRDSVERRAEPGQDALGRLRGRGHVLRSAPGPGRCAPAPTRPGRSRRRRPGRHAARPKGRPRRRAESPPTRPRAGCGGSRRGRPPHRHKKTSRWLRGRRRGPAAAARCPPGSAPRPVATSPPPGPRGRSLRPGRAGARPGSRRGSPWPSARVDGSERRSCSSKSRSNAPWGMRRGGRPKPGWRGSKASRSPARGRSRREADRAGRGGPGSCASRSAARARPARTSRAERSASQASASRTRNARSEEGGTGRALAHEARFRRRGRRSGVVTTRALRPGSHGVRGSGRRRRPSARPPPGPDARRRPPPGS